MKSSPSRILLSIVNYGARTAFIYTDGTVEWRTIESADKQQKK